MRKKRKPKRRIGISVVLIRAVCIALLVFCVGLDAQQKNEDTSNRLVQGTVTDAGNHPVAGAVVQLKNSKTLQIRSFITQDDGAYHFAGLGSDVEYELRADLHGASTSWKSLSVFNTDKIAIINLKIKK